LGLSKQLILASLPTDVTAANLDLQMMDGDVLGATTTYGGADARVGASLVCTTGFTVIYGGTTGVSTDGHCGSSLNSYRDFHTGITHSMTYQNGFVGTWGDFEWLTTSGTEVDDFYVDGAGTDTETIRLGLKALVRHAAYERLRGLLGSEPHARDVTRRCEAICKKQGDPMIPVNTSVGFALLRMGAYMAGSDWLL
jgi:hypothetical protein